VWRAPKRNIELVPKKKVLDFELPPRLEQAGDEGPEQMEDGKHHAGSCYESSRSRESAWMEFSGTTTRRYDAPSNRPRPSSSHQFCPDCITATRGYDFRCAR
jgi:hypothetical protein